MKPEQLTHATQELINNAVKIAQEQHNPLLLPLHLLAASLETHFCLSLYAVLRINVADLKRLVAQELAKLPESRGSQIAGDQTLQTYFNLCEKEAKALNDEYII